MTEMDNKSGSLLFTAHTEDPDRSVLSELEEVDNNTDTSMMEIDNSSPLLLSTTGTEALTTTTVITFKEVDHNTDTCAKGIDDSSPSLLSTADAKALIKSVWTEHVAGLDFELLKSIQAMPPNLLERLASLDLNSFNRVATFPPGSLEFLVSLDPDLLKNMTNLTLTDLPSTSASLKSSLSVDKPDSRAYSSKCNNQSTEDKPSGHEDNGKRMTDLASASTSRNSSLPFNKSASSGCMTDLALASISRDGSLSVDRSASGEYSLTHNP